MITIERLNELFEYRDGNLYRKVTTSSRALAGSVAGCVKPKGYVNVSIDRNTYQLHRLVFLMHHGYLPDEVDHIDNNPANNRIENLRAATREQNTRNSLIRKDNNSGIKGVGWSKSAKMWRAHIRVNGKMQFLGHFSKLDDAAEAVRVAREKLHGEFANHGA
ncbi:HNH endonuclease [Flavobacterium sp.]|jgi:hypothetical protein|uniref:HNH endonuclease n=1 Tax=Flavobacterium sp. TaxID=239 RepID=UPI0037C07752